MIIREFFSAPQALVVPAWVSHPHLAWMWFFLIAVAVYFTLKIGLNLRQIDCIQHHQSRVPDALASKISLESHLKSARYGFILLRLARIALILEVAMLLVWTLGGGLEALAGVVLRFTDAPLHFGVVLIVGFNLLQSLLDLPLAYVRQFFVESAFGFNRMTVKMWLVDLVKSTAVSLALGVPLLYAILALMQTFVQSWWLWAWGVFVGFNLLMMWIYPTWIAPLFNTFTPLPDGGLKTRLEALLSRCGFASRGMFVMDGSRRSGHGNAYFTGFGKSKRIVFYDTLLAQLSDAQIEAVLAHELGHFHHKHIIKRMAAILPLSVLVLAALGALATQEWFYTGLGFRPEHGVLTQLALEPAHLYAVGLILFGLVLPVVLFLLSPLFAYFSRRDEFEADTFAAQHSNPQDLIDALVVMYEENAKFVVTDTWYSRFYDSHPPALVRIAHLQKWVTHD